MLLVIQFATNWQTDLAAPCLWMSTIAVKPLPNRKQTLKSEIRNPKFAMVSFDWSFFYESTVRSD
jgi:hypothetical protein